MISEHSILSSLYTTRALHADVSGSPTDIIVSRVRMFQVQHYNDNIARH